MKFKDTGKDINIPKFPKSLCHYLAGLIDGDGSILIIRRDKLTTIGDRKRGESFETSIKIGGEPKHLKGLQKEMGGIGYIWIRKRPGQRHLAEWSIAGRYCRPFLKQIIEHLRLKKKQAQLVLDFPRIKSRWDATPQIKKFRLGCWKKMKRLNQTGRGRIEKHKY